MRMKIAGLFLLVGSLACSDAMDPAADQGEPDAGEDLFLGDGGDTPSDANGADGGADALSDVEGDTSEVGDTQVEVGECDRDGDGAMSEECGGDDCDDFDRTRAPGINEYCDEVDNNCDGEVNEGLDCWFYAHTGEALYEVDPFAGRANRVTEVPDLFDMDTHPDGTLYGLTREALFRFDPQARRWIQVGAIDTIEDANGLAIDLGGEAFVTAMNSLYTVDLQTAQVSRVGSIGGDFYSSGDCVVNKFDSLFMTSKDREDREANDTFVLLDRDTGGGMLVGDVGFRSVFALTAGWGRIFGLTSRGELLEIDRNTGAGTLLHTFEDMRWYGAASTPTR